MQYLYIHTIIPIYTHPLQFKFAAYLQK